jgi:uncharacterized protein (DUF1499 family)
MASTPSRLPPCRRTPNCVSTQAPEGSSKRMDPIPYSGTLAQARARMLQILRDHPRTRIVQEEPDYLKAECRSQVFHFVDDVEILFDDEARQIHFRSASRLGFRDFGVNRERMETIRKAFLAAGAFG